MQKTVAGLEVLHRFRRELEKRIRLERLVLFGSRVRGTFHGLSDFDLLVVSRDFEGVPWHRRAVPLYLLWRVKQPLELLCLTPREVERLKQAGGVVSEALGRGVDL